MLLNLFSIFEIANIRLVTNLYWGQRAVVKVGDDRRYKLRLYSFLISLEHSTRVS